MRLIDSHCHVHFSDFDADRAEVVARAAVAGIGLITVGTEAQSSASAVDFAAATQGVWVVIGQHPSETENFDPAFYKKLAANKKVVAIGEIGLDLHYDALEGKEKMLAAQTILFRQQLDLADELNLPVVVHTRDAHAPTLAILTEYISAGKLARRGVMHCFTGTAAAAQEYLALGFYISFPGIVTFPPRKNETENSLWATVRAVPLDKILVETDAPWLAPASHRGQRNEPAWVEDIARVLAVIRNLTPEEFFAQTTANANQLFQLF